MHDSIAFPPTAVERCHSGPALWYAGTFAGVDQVELEWQVRLPSFHAGFPFHVHSE